MVCYSLKCPQLNSIYEMKRFNKIVLIDDDVISNMVFEKLSTASGLTQELITIISPLDALVFFENLPTVELPDAIFLDIKMPILSGWEFLTQFKQISRIESVKVFIISSSVNYYDIQRAEKENAISSFISKPISMRKLLDIKNQFSTELGESA